MSLTRTGPFLALSLALGACAAQQPPSGPAAPGEASARLVRADGREVALARISDQGSGLRVAIEAAGLAAGTYGLHVHAIGRCDPPAFDSAGPHWNPASRQHGSLNPAGPHRGDLPNLQVGTDGRGTLVFTIPDARLTGGADPLLDGDGAAIVLHAGADDYRTDPSGNSGARIACGRLG